MAPRVRFLQKKLAEQGKVSKSKNKTDKAQSGSESESEEDVKPDLAQLDEDGDGVLKSESTFDFNGGGKFAI